MQKEIGKIFFDHISLIAKQDNEIIIAIYNMAGEILINEKFYKQFEIEVDRFYPGTYMSVIKIKDKIYNYNFLVIK